MAFVSSIGTGRDIFGSLRALPASAAPLVFLRSDAVAPYEEGEVSRLICDARAGLIGED